MKKTTLIQYYTESGEHITIEANDDISNTDNFRGSSKEADVLTNVSTNFNSIIEPIKTISDSIDKNLRSMNFCPNEISIEFNLKVSVKAGIIISSFDTEANFKVSLKWAIAK